MKNDQMLHTHREINEYIYFCDKTCLAALLFPSNKVHHFHCTFQRWTCTKRTNSAIPRAGGGKQSCAKAMPTAHVYSTGNATAFTPHQRLHNQDYSEQVSMHHTVTVRVAPSYKAVAYNLSRFSLKKILSFKGSRRPAFLS